MVYRTSDGFKRLGPGRGVCVLRLIVVPVLVLLVFGCSGGGSDNSDSASDATASEAQTYRVQGSLTLRDGSWDVGESCRGSGGYSDITSGAQVVVRNQDGTILATGRLGAGTAVQIPGTTLTFTGRCEFRFDVRSLPKEDFYSFEVSHRGEITYSFQEMRSASWEVHLTLG